MRTHLKSCLRALGRRLALDAEGQTLLEYALIITSIAVLAVGALTILGGDVFGYISGAAKAF